jgi:protein BCP1
LFHVDSHRRHPSKLNNSKRFNNLGERVMEKKKTEASTTAMPSIEKKEETEPHMSPDEDDPQIGVAKLPPKESSEDESSDEEDDDLILEGVIIRNPEVESSDDESSSENPTDKKRKAGSPSQATKKAKGSRDPDIIQVEFTFSDMDEKFFHGIKTLLHSSSTIYAPDSSALSDLMVENVSVGTVISTEGDDEGNVFGFASVLNVTTNGSQPCIQRLVAACLDECPEQHKVDLETVLSGKTKRPAGFLLHGRMINLPLEVVEVLHQQLVLDMDWAVVNAEGGDEERKSLDFGAFVRLAPTFPSNGSVVYKYFDDEVFANNSEFVYTIDAPKPFGSEDKQVCRVIVMTKTGHREAMIELAQLVNGT